MCERSLHEGWRAGQQSSADQSSADQLVRAIRAQGGEVEYLRFPDEGHGIRKLSNRIIAYRRIARFLERTLGVEGTRD